MNASIVKRSVVILGAIAVPWVGCALWSAHREQAEKDALAAEIRAEIAARPRWPDRSPERRDLTAEYDAILAGLGNDRDASELSRHVEVREPWTGVPKPVTSSLEAHAVALSALDALAARGQPGWTRCFGGGYWRSWRHLRLLLSGRGRACIVRGDWDGLLRTIRALRRAADDVLGSFVLPGGAEPAATAGGLEDEALALMAIAAVDPALTEAAAVDLLAVAGGPWIRGEAFDAMQAWRRGHSDDLCLELLGPKPVAVAAMKRNRILASDDFLDRMERLLPSRPEPMREQPTAPPSAEVVRRMREVYRRYHDAEGRRDAAAIALGGELDREAVLDLGGQWTGRHVSAYLVWSRSRWRLEARLPVLRAAFAIRIHETRWGHTPLTLDGMVPWLLDAVPVDAWTGKPVFFDRGPGAYWKLEAGPPRGDFNHGRGLTERTEPYRLEKK